MATPVYKNVDGLAAINNFTDVTTTTSAPDFEPGLIKWAYDTANNEMAAFKYVKYENTADAGDAVCYQYNTASKAGYYVNQPETETFECLAGICMGTIAAAGNYGWIQIYGYSETILVVASIATAAGITGSIALGNKLGCINDKDYLANCCAAGTASMYPNYVIAYETYTQNASTALNGFIKCLNG